MCHNHSNCNTGDSMPLNEVARTKQLLHLHKLNPTTGGLSYRLAYNMPHTVTHHVCDHERRVVIQAGLQYATHCNTSCL